MDDAHNTKMNEFVRGQGRPQSYPNLNNEFSLLGLFTDDWYFSTSKLGSGDYFSTQ